MSNAGEHNVKVGRAFAVEFKDIERWDPARIHAIRWNWPPEQMIRIGDLLTARKDRVDRKQWSFGELQPVTVHNDGRISKRKVDQGRSYTMDLWFAWPGDLLVAKIDLKNGAIAIVPDDWKNVAVTNHFVPFEIDRKRVVPEYLHRVFQMVAFRDLLWRNKVGAEGRKEVKLEFFLDQCVPLPSLANQRSIVAHWQAGMQQAAALEAKAQKLVEEAQAGFEQQLGINAPPQGEQRKVFAIDFMALDRWGVRPSLVDVLKSTQRHEDFPIVRFGDVIEGLENGWSPKCHDRPANETEWGVLKLGAVSFGTFNAAENKALPNAFAPKQNLEVHAGDVLIIRGNVLRLVGAFAYVDTTRPRLMLPDLIFRVKFKNEHVLDPQFLVALMQCADLRQQIESVATGTSPTMKKVTVGSLLDLEFPLPPIERQLELLKPLSNALAHAASMKEQAEAKRKETKEEVEGMVMGRSTM